MRGRVWVPAAVLAGLWLAVAPPAAAHEFSIVVVASDAAASVDARRGFRVAVDESPDVTHPPGQEAGDHLGGIDVDIVTVDAGEPEAAASRVAELLDAGAAAVVSLATGPATGGVSDIASSAGVLHVVVEEDAAGTGQEGAIVLRLRPLAERDAAQVQRFASAFTDQYRTRATEAAQLGYDAGRLLDSLVGEFGETLQPGDSMALAARGASNDLATADVQVVPAGRTDDPGSVPPALAGRPASGAGLLLGGVSLLLAGGAGLVVARRARHG